MGMIANLSPTTRINYPVPGVLKDLMTNMLNIKLNKLPVELRTIMALNLVHKRMVKRWYGLKLTKPKMPIGATENWTI